MRQRVDERCDLDAWLRPYRLQTIGCLKSEVAMFGEPRVEQRNIMRPMLRIGAEDVEQFNGIGEIALVVRLCCGNDGRRDEIVLRGGRLHQEPGAE